jgi:hypothetical protein
MGAITLLHDQIRAGDAFVDAHRRSAEASGAIYADALWRNANGRELSGEWFEDAVIVMNRTVASVYRLDAEDARPRDDSFVQLMVVSASRAMWKRLAELQAKARIRRAA